MHIHRWDLDRTYLDTDIHSVRGLIRSAFETAAEKRNIPGSATLMRALASHDPGARLHVLSGSPTQMRRVLGEKLTMDGVKIERMILKDSLLNIRRGRLSAVREQVGYKLPMLLSERAGTAAAPVDSSVRETLYGDDSESDAVIYAAYSAAVAGRIGERDIVRILDAAGAYPDVVALAVESLRRIRLAPAVEDIFIHLDRGSPLDGFVQLPGVTPVFSWFQAAVVLWTRNRISIDGLVETARACSLEGKLAEAGLVGLVQDLARRRVVDVATLVRLVGHDALAPLRKPVLRSLVLLGEPPPPAPVRPTDFVAALSRPRPEG